MQDFLLAVFRELKKERAVADAETFCDAIWLIAHGLADQANAIPQSEELNSKPVDIPEPVNSETLLPPTPVGQPQEIIGARSSTATSQPHVASVQEIYERREVHTISEATPGGHVGRRIALPAAQRINCGIAFDRALKLIRQKRKYTGKNELDEEATAIASARGKYPEVIFRHTKGRWLDIQVVIEKSPTMRIWQDTAHEFRHLIDRTFAPLSLKTFYLEWCGNALQLRTFGGRIVSPKTIRSGNPNRIVLLLSDAISNGWLTSAIQSQMFEWSQEHATTLIQMLPQRMWGRSALRNATLTHCSPFSERPGRRLQSFNVVTIEPLQLKCFSRWLVGVPDAKLISVASSTANLDRSLLTTVSNSASFEVSQLSREQIDTIYERFERFASPQARQLVRHLVNAPLTIPVMKLIHRVLVPEAIPATLAEIFLSGILYRPKSRPSSEPMPDDQIEYEFLEGLRDKFRQFSEPGDVLATIHLLSRYCENRFGQAHAFGAVLAGKYRDLDQWNTAGINPEERSFATVGASLAKWLGSEPEQHSTVTPLTDTYLPASTNESTVAATVAFSPNSEPVVARTSPGPYEAEKLVALNPQNPIPVHIGRGTWRGAFGIEAKMAGYTLAVQLPAENEDIFGLFSIDLPGEVPRIDDPSNLVDRLGRPAEQLEATNSCVYFKGTPETRFWLVVSGVHAHWEQSKFRGGGLLKPHRLNTFYLEDGESTWHIGPTLVFRLDLKRVMFFSNPFALDLGATSTCAAYLAGDPPEIKLFQFNGQTSIPSLVLYRQRNTGETDIVIGEKAKRSDGLRIRNFKRHMGDGKHRFSSEDRTVRAADVYRDYVKQLLSEFETETNTFLKKLTATYPPGYSLQAQGSAIEVYESLGIETEPSPFRVDEASAAAVYYVWQRISECDKHVSTYRALYGDDHTLLVCDIGGGTTDISLVHIHVNMRSETVVSEEIELSVVATTSLSDVCGDNFTLEVMKAIKCHIALSAAEAYQRTRTLPEFLSEVETNVLCELADMLPTYRQELQSTSEDLTVLQKLEQKAEYIVPTAWKRFESGEDADPFAWRRANLAFYQLWQTAEHAKIHMVETGQTRIQLGSFGENLRLRQLGILESAEIVLSCETDLHRRIYPAIRKAVKACRHLATSPNTNNLVLDSIQLAGNSSRIPMVAQLVKTEFHHDFHNTERLVRFDKESAKSSVAIGACIASYLNDYGMQLPIRMKFNPVPERLGWEIGVYNPTMQGDFQVYFHADARPSERPTYELPDTGQHALALFRRRVGDGARPEFLGKFLLTTEPQVIQGLSPLPDGILQLILVGSDKLRLRRGDAVWRMHIPDRSVDPNDPFSGLH